MKADVIRMREFNKSEHEQDLDEKDENYPVGGMFESTDIGEWGES
jgi:hypothetical protein